MKWTAAELLDTTARRKDDEERDYGDGAATVVSAMVRESEGERQGEWRVQGLRGATCRRPGVQGVGGKQVTPWRAQACRRHLPACLAGKKQLAGAGQHSAGPPGGPAGELAGLRQVSFSLSLFLFFLFILLFL